MSLAGQSQQVRQLAAEGFDLADIFQISLREDAGAVRFNLAVQLFIHLVPVPEIGRAILQAPDLRARKSPDIGTLDKGIFLELAVSPDLP